MRAGLLIERIAEIRADDTWRNIRAQLETIKVVEYERGEARLRQTTEVRAQVADLLKRLKVEPPPRLHPVATARRAQQHEGRRIICAKPPESHLKIAIAPCVGRRPRVEVADGDGAVGQP